MANLDGDATGARGNGVDQSAPSDANALDGNEQGAQSPGDQPILMAQADTAATDPTGAVNGIYDAPAGVTLDNIDTDGRDLVVTLPSGDVIRIEDAADQFNSVEIDGLVFPLLFEQVEPAADTATGSSGGNFETDPGEIDPGLPITPLLPPTELAFGFPEQEEIFLLEDTEPEVVSAQSTLVDEDGFRFANLDQVPPRAGIETDGDENLVDTGVIVINYNQDLPVDLDAAFVLDDLGSYDGQLESDGQPVVFALDGGDLVGTVDGGATEVIRISIVGSSDNGDNTVDYTYEVTLSQPLDHPSNDSEDTTFLQGVQFTATDRDGDPVSGTFDVGILDDVPEAFDDDFTQGGNNDYLQEFVQVVSNGENEPISGNVLDDNGHGADVFGADGEGTPTVSLVAGSYNSTDPDGKGDVSGLTLNADGSFTYTPAPGEQGTVTFDYTIRDDDGDESRATVTIELQPDSTPEAEDTNAVVDEDGLTDGNADTGPLVEIDGGDSNVGTGTITIDYGNDVPSDLDAAIVLDTTGLNGQLTSGGEAVTFALVGGDLVGSTVSLGEVIRISIDATPTNTSGGEYEYTYTVTLSQPIDHPLNDLEDILNLTGISYTATDSDSDPVSGTFDVAVYDDVPIELDGATLTITNQAVSTASATLTFDAGADQPGSIVFVGTDDTQAFDTDGNPISNGGLVYLTGFGTDTLIGYVDENGNGDYDDGIDTIALQVELDPDTDTWTGTAMINVELDNGTETTFDFAGGISGGNVDVFALGEDDPSNNNSNTDLIIEGDPGTVNTSFGNLAVDNNWIDGTESVKFEFVENAVTAATTTGFDWTDQVETTIFSQEVTDVSGGPSNRAAFTVTALYTDGDQTVYGDGDDTTVAITTVRVYDGGTLLFEATGTDSDVGTGISVTFSGGEVLFEGIDDGWTYEIETDDPFTGVQVAGDASTDDFRLGAVTIGAAQATEPFDMQFDIAGSDSDGDTLTDTLTLHVEPPPEAAAAGPAPATTSFAGGAEGGGGGGGLDTSGFFDGGTGGEGPNGFAASFFGEGSSTEFDLVGDFSQFPQNAFDNQISNTLDTGFDKAGALVLEGPSIAHGIEMGSLDNNFGGSLELSPEIGQGDVNDLGASATGELRLADMVDQHEFDLGSLLGDGPALGGLNTVPLETVESGLSGGIAGLQIADEMTYDHS